jgi:Domain of unknown function (DUF6316)
MDSVNRKDGYFPGTFFKRSNRIVVASEGVYIRIREHKTIGPYKTFREAEMNLREFLRKVDSNASMAMTRSAPRHLYSNS